MEGRCVGLWIENPVVSQDLMVEINVILLAVNFVQFVLSVNSSSFSSPKRILHKSSLWMPS